jgi:hypothetical protein
VEGFADVGSGTATAVESERSHGRKFLLVGLRFRQLRVRSWSPIP